MTDRPISELFVTLVQWAIARGADNIRALPGVWHGETDEWEVRLNGHPREIDDVPPFGYFLVHKTALCGIARGTAFDGHVIGPSEDALIDHFRSRMEIDDA